MKRILSAFLLLQAMSIFAAPGGKDPDAEGFADWEGVTDKNYIYGRMITPSDLRQRTVVLIHLDAQALHGQFLRTDAFISALGYPQAHAVTWDTLEEYTRDVIPVVIVHGECDAALFKQALRVPKGKEATPEEQRALQAWNEPFIAVYNDKVKLAGSSAPAKNPSIQVLLPDSTTFAIDREGSGSDQKFMKEFRAALAKGKAAQTEWKSPFGVAEVKHWQKAEKIIKDGKAAQGALVLLKVGIKDRDPEKAKEAQIMYDALLQEKGNLTTRILSEFRTAPARAFVDLYKLLKLFPAEKKKLQIVDQKIKQSKAAITIGKMCQKYLEWNEPEFTFKSASDAKNAVKMIDGWKKQLDLVSQDQTNPQLAGEAALLGSLLEGCKDSLASKVPQK